jgi:hypothetical protein
MASHYYEIRLAGTLPPEILVDFERLTARAELATTMVHGLLPDRAALGELLTRLELLGGRVEEIRRLRN